VCGLEASLADFGDGCVVDDQEQLDVRRRCESHHKTLPPRPPDVVRRSGNGMEDLRRCTTLRWKGFLMHLCTNQAQQNSPCAPIAGYDDLVNLMTRFQTHCTSVLKVSWQASRFTMSWINWNNKRTHTLTQRQNLATSVISLSFILFLCACLNSNPRYCSCCSATLTTRPTLPQLITLFMIWHNYIIHLFRCGLSARLFVRLPPLPSSGSHQGCPMCLLLREKLRREIYGCGGGLLVAFSLHTSSTLWMPFSRLSCWRVRPSRLCYTMKLMADSWCMSTRLPYVLWRSLPSSRPGRSEVQQCSAR